jgi:Xaa-Pro aminopeptidase
MARTSSNGPASPYPERLQVVREAMTERGLDCLLVSGRENVRYLFGFTGSSGWAIVTHDRSVFMTDSRYDEQAHAEVAGCEICISTRGLPELAARRLGACGAETVGFEADSVTVATLNTLEGHMRQDAPDLVLVPVQQLVETVRCIKDEREIAAITAASRLLDGAVEHVRSILRPGMSERTLAWEIERWLREHGSGPMPFTPIVAAGPHCAHPHAVPCELEVVCGQSVLIDIGAVVDGYCSDLSRTLFVGEPEPAIGRVYSAVLDAQLAASDGVLSGMSAVEADALARDSIRAAGYGECFGHGLGHGVGLAVHERPTVSSLSKDVLVQGMVFTIEPGIYVPGLGGVRIEDTVVLRDSGVQPLTRAEKRNPVCAPCEC